MTDTPEDRRDAAIADAIALGASIVSTTPLADPTTPHTVAAYRVTFGAPDTTVLTALAGLQQETAITTAGLVDWSPEEVVEDAGSGA